MVEFAKDQLVEFAKLIEQELGVVYAETNLYQLQGRLEMLATQYGIENVREIWDKVSLKLDQDLRRDFFDKATNNETSFFRDKNFYAALENYVFPKFTDQSTCKIWSAACSTGQEPYSVRILIHEVAEKTKFPTLEMNCTDFSDRVLERAKMGVYSQIEVQRGLSAPRLIKHFEKHNNEEWIVKSHLRKGLHFEQLNLLGSVSHLGTFDLILIRNMLIYQSLENKKIIIEKLTQQLKSGGFLFLGAAETLIGLSNDYHQITAEGAIVYQKK